MAARRRNRPRWEHSGYESEASSPRRRQRSPRSPVVPSPLYFQLDLIHVAQNDRSDDPERQYFSLFFLFLNRLTILFSFSLPVMDDYLKTLYDLSPGVDGSTGRRAVSVEEALTPLA